MEYNFILQIVSKVLANENKTNFIYFLKMLLNVMSQK